MVQNVVQERGSGRSPFEYLREFVDSATALGLPDETKALCIASFWGGDVVRLRTMAGDSLAEASGSAVSASTRAGTGDGYSEERTIVSQDSTGPRVSWRRWGRSYSAPTLTLGDVRALITRVDELGLPTEKYIVRGSRVAWSSRRTCTASPRRR